ncbi:hypothetical protein BK717_00870 [Bacillus thuringiensis serovar malayensis]|nr:hypothetical protein BK717_00870 [Bacillus thuringiensis serovar malayensis]
MAKPNRNSSPTYRWATPITRLRKETSFRGSTSLKQKVRYFKLSDITISFLLSLKKIKNPNILFKILGFLGLTNSTK